MKKNNPTNDNDGTTAEGNELPASRNVPNTYTELDITIVLYFPQYESAMYAPINGTMYITSWRQEAMAAESALS